MKSHGHPAIWRRTAAVVLSFTLLFPPASSSIAAVAADTESARIEEVMNLLQQNHVANPNPERLADVAIQSMVQSLNDPYTVYFSAEELKKFEGSLQNNYVGVGIRVLEQPDGVYVSEVFDGPAQKAGMQVDDMITAVNGEPVTGLNIDEVTNKIIGPEGTPVSVTVQRGAQRVVLEMTRQTIQLPVVTHKKFDPGIGYIRVTSFSSDADELTAAQLAELKQSGINSLILDLRYNPGGIVDTAVNMARLFVKEGILIHTKDKDNVDHPVKFADGTTQPFPVYILVNEYSASASEVLTGALQDYNAAAKVIGMKTYGKGSVQTLFPLTGGGALKITIEEYLTPNMRKVNNVGIAPDIEVDGEVPQLVTALQQAGIGKVSLVVDERGVKVNGIAVDDEMNVVRENGVYIPSRVLSALLGGTIAWNEQAQAIDLAAAGAAHTFQQATGDLLLKDGISYVNMANVSASFPQLQWSDNEGQLALTVS
ncbi:S41 family peptidase [Paenibacillus xerothermodurans]|uniref:S41 family peptidase n=1 Tax=Paenibacillus xerothermodurans TaxID=1977292 RepID=A0A2W1NBP4_PAEXE|nr:S41 family peptidase [Paenibacillus xerothermodurans]PZE21857.1 S41 family peptidase [Paenibacillus xerothermodurans]